jgi:hypothetical protein
MKFHENLSIWSHAITCGWRLRAALCNGFAMNLKHICCCSHLIQVQTVDVFKEEAQYSKKPDLCHSIHQAVLSCV